MFFALIQINQIEDVDMVEFFGPIKVSNANYANQWRKDITSLLLLVYVPFSDMIYAEWTFHLSKSESTNKNRGKFKNTFHTLIQRYST